MQLIEVKVFIYPFTVFTFIFKALFVCAKDRVCLKVAILIKKIKKAKNHLAKHEKVSMFSLKFKDISKQGQRRNLFFSKMHIGMV